MIDLVRELAVGLLGLSLCPRLSRKLMICSSGIPILFLSVREVD